MCAAAQHAPTWRACACHAGRSPAYGEGLSYRALVNELPADARESVRAGLLGAARDGYPVLVIEPLAGAAAPWWTAWAEEFAGLGARIDEWRLPADLPEIVARFDRAAGLRHDQLTARTIYAAGK